MAAFPTLLGMTQFLNSSLYGLTDPVGFFWGCLVIVALWAAAKRRWSFFGFVVGILLVLQLFAGTNLPRILIGRLEAPFDPRVNPLPERADAVVMLGGTLDFGPRERLRIQLGDAADRIITAADLIREGRAPVLVLSSAPYLLEGELRPDSELITAWFRTWRLPTGELLRLPLCRNTREEALQVAELSAQRGWKRILLVSSAFHLRRAVATFARSGLTNVVPVGCDFRGVNPAEARLEFTGVPASRGLDTLAAWAHEEVGWWYYRFRGWR